MHTLRFTVSILLGIALPYALQRWDRGRLPPARRARAWNAASWGSALYVAGPLSMLGWCWVTRQRFRARRRRDGLAVAVAWSVVVLLAGLALALGMLVAVGGVDELLRRLAGAPE
jgi:hypothetical protein